jgi:rod shape-determining protein MreC
MACVFTSRQSKFISGLRGLVLKKLLKIFKNNTFRLFFGVLLVFSGIIFYTHSVPENEISCAINCVIIPLEQLSFRLSNAALDLVAKSKKTSELEEKIELLENEVRQLRGKLIDYYDVKKENAQYAKYYDLKKDNSSLKFVSASVVGRDPGDFFKNFVIDRGSTSGISVNDAVITQNGIVGCIFRVNANSSIVRTVLSQDMRLGVIDKESKDSGIIMGNARLAESNLTRMMYIPSQNSIKPGDILVSSGLSGMYPKNLRLGKVVRIDYDNFYASSYAVVEPFENIGTVQQVFVIIYFHGKGEMSSVNSMGM